MQTLIGNTCWYSEKDYKSTSLSRSLGYDSVVTAVARDADVSHAAAAPGRFRGVSLQPWKLAGCHLELPDASDRS